MKFWKKGATGGSPTRIFFASDIHGSEPTFRKFLNAARRYEVDHVIFGGDLMGKGLVPVVRTSAEEWVAYRPEGPQRIVGKEALQRLKGELGTLGLYWWEGEPDEYSTYRNDSAAVEKLFDKVARARLATWLEVADEKLAGTDTRLFMCGGNDDTDALISLLDEQALPHVVAADNRVVQLDDQHALVSLGLSTPTPWDTPRERPDEYIRGELERLMASVDDPESCILNVHVPPLNSTLDRCVQLDASVWPPKPVFSGGQPVFAGVGSAAVRDVLQDYHPVVGLHGHIHESRGLAKIGTSMAFNAGSEYGEGILRGLIVAVKDRKVTAYQFTSA